MWVWGIAHQGLGTLHFFTVIALWLVAMSNFNTATEPANVSLVFSDMAMYIAVYTWTELMYVKFFPSWIAGMKLEEYNDIIDGEEA